MNKDLKRRTFLAGTTLSIPALAWLSERGILSAASAIPSVPDEFPSQARGLVQETVAVAHGNLDRLRELVEATPALARASWDWGFGDWESALGAASHMGRRDIAEYLLAKGARPNIYSAAMLGQLAVVRAYIETSPGIQRTPGPHGIPLLSHARAGGDPARRVVEYLEAVGGADEREPTEPLPEEALQVYLGNYRFDSGANDWIKIEKGRNGLLLSRGDGTGRPLGYRGDHLFFPFASPRVTIRFQVENGRAIDLQIDSGDSRLTAQRTGF